MDIAKWEGICRAHGLSPVGKSEHRLADVYVAERQIPGNALSADPIECQTHFEIAWALDRRGGMAYGRTVKVKAMDYLTQADRVKFALKDAVDHILMGARVGSAKH